MTVRSRGSSDSGLLAALDQRLTSVAARLLPDLPPEYTTASGDAPGWPSAHLLPRLVDALGERPGPPHWLMLTAVAGRFPLAVEVEELARRVALDRDGVAEFLLSHVLADPGLGRLDLEMDVVSNRVVVDVDYCSRFDTNTGIQRVVRETLPRWRRHHDVMAVANVDERSGYRNLTPREQARVFDFENRATHEPDDEDYTPSLVVPWQTTVLWPEVIDPHACPRIACLAQYSGNTVGLIAYDMIPILTTELRPFGEAGIFARYLSAVKHSHRVAGISSSATTEFRGFAEMLSAQGLPGPRVSEVELAEDVSDHAAGDGNPVPERPHVLVTGRREPHKNLRAALHAAQRLWTEGLDFEVTMLGGHGWDEIELNETIQRLKADGRPLTTLGWVTDAEMWGQIRRASFVVFASLHEGYGLPISEALACGTPVITTNYGSQREVAVKGGCILVDPRSDEELTNAMRMLISSPQRLTELREEIVQRPKRTWDDYARDLWDCLVLGEGGRDEAS